MVRLEDKYRPKKWDTYIGQKHIVNRLQQIEIIDFEDMPNLFFVGMSGTGKTVAAEVVYRNMRKQSKNLIFKKFNASDDRGIDVVRNEIKKLAMIKNPKIIFLDEMDRITPIAQDAMRVIMEDKLFKNTRFILSCNHENRVIKAMKSRCARFVFHGHSDQDVIKHVLHILDSEGIEYAWNNPTGANDEKFQPTDFQQALAIIVSEREGDLRGVINDLSTLITNDKQISVQNVIEMQPTQIGAEIFQKAFNGKYKDARDMLEDVIIQKKYRYEWLIEEWRNAIKTVNPPEVEMRLGSALGLYESRCRAGNKAIVQLTAFLSYVSCVKFLPK